MPHIQASLDFLADIPLYDYEKPYLALLPPQEGFDPDSERTDNLEWETHSDITITDIRGNFNLYTIEECGFQVVHHASRDLDLQSTDSLNAYKKETEVLLNKELEAIHLRRNVKFERDSFDINDPFLIEGPAKGAHNDVTFGSGPEMIARYLNAEHKSRFFKPGYRFRIVK
ncbi:MAG: hypothetical protein M1827_001000 [Pycnora praestabilis]|nr:MAG: hypothetical protein M1827_001000 [Pycnora praestabilis]